MLRLTVATVIKTVCHWQKDTHIDQWNRIENPETDLHKYAQLVFPCLFFFVCFSLVALHGLWALPQPGIESELAAVKVLNPNHRTAREFPAQPILTKMQKQFNGGRVSFSTNSPGAIGHPLKKKRNPNLNVTPHTAINSKWIMKQNYLTLGK